MGMRQVLFGDVKIEMPSGSQGEIPARQLHIQIYSLRSSQWRFGHSDEETKAQRSKGTFLRSHS